jgi:2-polyprenyl-6-methoxyphenol hydroxylase-like FAD-dependent oxidoreductase
MTDKPVLIVGAGISGLLLAQHLRHRGISFKIFDRHVDIDGNSFGWGLTILRSLPALRSLLPEDIFRRLPEAYVDRTAVGDGLARFPFFDLSTGELQASGSYPSMADGIRVSRQKFRRLLATDLEIQACPSVYSRVSPFQLGMDESQWGKAANHFATRDDGSVTVYFDDGSSTEGSLLVACEGRNSRIRRQLFPNQGDYQIPVGCVAATVYATADAVEPLRQLDPFFLQGTASNNDTLAYFSR